MKIGKISESALKRSVLRQIHTRRDEIVSGAGLGEDCAIFALADGEKMVSCVQESAVAASADARIFMQDKRRDLSGNENIRKSDDEQQSLAQETDRYTVRMGHLIRRCANNLAACGAEPVAIQIILLLPESVEEPYIKQLMTDAEATCKVLNIQIAGGQTRVTPTVNMPYATVTGYGKVSENAYRSAIAVAPGQDIVISKWIGLEGTAFLAKQNRQKLLERYPAYFVDEAAGFDRFLSIIPEAATAAKSGVCAMHDASEGGIFSTLWELAEGAGVGLTIDLKKLPLRQETVEVCELLGVNPYELRSGGCLVMTSEDGNGLVAALKEAQIPAVVVGKLTDSNDRIIKNEDEVRYMDRPKQDAVYTLSN